MNEEDDGSPDSGVHDDEQEEFDAEYATERTTAPQGPYTTRDVGVGFVVALVGMALVFGVPVAVIGL